ncbi:DNA/RNA non-specific endonuclease [Aquimarina litoralis]|uniref:DNA/RNA non-specific endonuclease n=1 Tax=Aquimarina litoralis TaxID=584605 RepID=UPI001C587D7A|nr:DNA/RNA non-specific endonuclease [Aquimarina litoralis]MBW1297963.1 DNA/RNA non-specific endonuclease [Aquimarina litoralis]
MKRKYIYPLLVLIVTIGFYYAEMYIDTKDNTLQKNSEKKELSFFYLPTSTTGTIITHKNYALSYSEKHEQAEWVAYELKREHLSGQEFKRPFFEMDKKVRSSSADWRNYKNSGYDKGHLCPAGDRRFDYNAFKETFLTSNVSPQNHEFNAGIWNKLEQKTRYWAKKYDGVYVVTGGVLSDDLKTIGYEAVSVPNYFFKVILDKSTSNPKMIAFLVPHKKTNKSLKSFVVTTDELEKLTGIDFFSKLPDDLEKRLEMSKVIDNWKF